MAEISGQVTGIGARRAALFAFAAVLKGAAVESALAEHVAKGKIEHQSDRGFVRTLLLTLLRRGREADLRLQPFLGDADALPPRVRHLLWLGYVQLQGLDVAPHAVLNTATELAKTFESGRFAKLVNAVLRRATALPPSETAAATLAPWLAARWERAYGAEAVEAMAVQLLAPVPLDVTVRGDAAAWAAAAGGTLISAQTVRLPASTEVTGLPGFEEGAFWVQGAASTLPLSLLEDLNGKRVLDIGAAPGGKTAQLCAAGATVTALDISAGRLERLRENMQRLGFSPQIVTADARAYEPDSKFDLIVLDAPCSATGTLRRHPELSWQKGEADITRLAALQAELLDRALDWLQPEGEILFLTCSLEPEEGEAQTAAVLQRHPNVEIVPFSATPFGRIEGGMLRLLPHDLASSGGNDGFFAARLRLRTG